MFVELATLGAIFGGSAIAVLAVKTKFQPQIEKNLAEIERRDVVVEEVEQHRKRQR